MLNSAQSIAINHRDGAMLVIAGPGSGKTLVITQRIKNLIEQYNVDPKDILVITFTKAAAIQMQYRFVKETKGFDYNVNFGTFHAIFFHILKQTYKFDASSILKESDKYRYLESIIDQFFPTINKELIPKFISEISKIKNSGIDVEEYETSICENEVFIDIYKKYKFTMIQYKKVDFDDMVYLTLRLLKERPKVLQYWQNKFKYILIDEFQDINPMQYEVVKLLATPRNNLFIVGDDDQSIYGFRGSNPQIMLNFPDDFPDCKRILLDVNYRSYSSIVESSIRLISNNKDRYIKDIKSNSFDDQCVLIQDFSSKYQQVHSISALIKEYMMNDGAQYKDIAILYRTNTGASYIAEELLKAKIPFNFKENTSRFYDKDVVKDILAYIYLAFNNCDITSFFRIMNKPLRYISRDSVTISSHIKEDIINYYIDNKNVLHNVLRLFDNLDFIKNMSPYAAINFIRKGIGYDEYLETKGNMDIEVLDELQEKAKEFSNINDWIEFIKGYESAMKFAKSRNDDCVNIVTMHASKGLEWPVVILPDLNEGVVPHKKSCEEDNIEEERRLLYVAMTRAKEKLFMFYVNEENKKKAGYCPPSRFLNEILEKQI